MQNVGNFYFKERTAKKKQQQIFHFFFFFLKAIVMGGSIDMNAGVFWETSVGFLKV